MPMPLPMPGENLTPRVARLQGDVATLEARLRSVESLLAQYRPDNVMLKDINGTLRRYSALARFQGTTTDLDFGLPFEIKDVSTREAVRVCVYKHSSLRKSLAANDRMTISGLDDGLGQGGFSVGLWDLIWLEVSFTDGSPTSAEINHGAGGWSSFPVPVEFTGTGEDKKQTKAYIAIAQIVDPSNDEAFEPPGIPLRDNLMVSQYLTSHLALLDICYEDTTCKYPFPHSGPVI
jgi:hypothetical protein